MNIKPMWLSDEQVARILTPAMAYDGVLAALSCHARGDFVQPLKPYVRPKGRDGEYDGGRYIAMPAFVGGDVRAAGVKWIGSVPKNVERGLPRASGVLVLNDVETGRPLAVMECATLSARRTAAVASVCFDLFAPQYRRVALIGCGPINFEVGLAFGSYERGIAEMVLCDLREERAKHLADSIAGKGLFPIEITSNPQQAVKGATVIVCATTGAKGYIQSEWVNSCKLMIPLSLEDCDPGVLLSANKIIVDDFDQCNREEKLLNRLVQQGSLSRENIYAELGQVVIRQKPGREGEEVVYANLMGMAMEDICVAQKVYRRIVTTETRQT
jgi:ornithine cyclodeaminase